MPILQEDQSPVRTKMDIRTDNTI